MTAASCCGSGIPKMDKPSRLMSLPGRRLINSAIFQAALCEGGERASKSPIRPFAISVPSCSKPINAHMSTPMPSKGIAIVTGAAQGIGRAVALRLADDGFDVAVNDLSIHEDKLDVLLHEIQRKGQASSKHIADVSQDVEVRQMVEHVVQDHGGLDVMVANAGVAGRIGSLTEVSLDEWDRVMRINAQGPFLCYKYAAIEMIKQGRGGRIIGASSLAGKQGGPQAAYSASKFAVRGLTQAAALELGKYEITVNAYAPGAVETPLLAGIDTPEKMEAIINQLKEMSPLKRIGSVEDISNLVSFLASKESQFITGQSISINGGVFFD
ncbi:hypothetical protein B0H19DRAFT_1140203 [Mycena capillaripes]|nr:hypothetical protein B0H19DRAFT_1140203 [Mycena capillaripes]